MFKDFFELLFVVQILFDIVCLKNWDLGISNIIDKYRLLDQELKEISNAIFLNFFFSNL